MQKQEQKLSLPFGERVTFLCLCKEKLTKRKHTLPPRPRRYATRVHSAGRIFRRDIPVPSKNDAHPCASPHSGSCLPAPSLRKGTRHGNSNSNSNNQSQSQSQSNGTPPWPSPCLWQREGKKQQQRHPQLQLQQLPSPLPLSRRTGEGMPIAIADPTRSTAAYIRSAAAHIHFTAADAHSTAEDHP